MVNMLVVIFTAPPFSTYDANFLAFSTTEDNNSPFSASWINPKFFALLDASRTFWEFELFMPPSRLG